jgi:ABC-type transport system involved in cytochrome c biogenesis permease component
VLCVRIGATGATLLRHAAAGSLLTQLLLLPLLAPALPCSMESARLAAPPKCAAVPRGEGSTVLSSVIVAMP